MQKELEKHIITNLLVHYLFTSIMKTIEVIGYKRANLGKSDAKRIRGESNVPCVLYGGKEQVHFYSPMILFRELVYTPEAAFVTLNIEGDVRTAILQDVQFHPVSEIILHADFLELQDDKLIKMDIPVKFIGNAPGVLQGGRLLPKLRKIRIKALPKDMPESIDVDISSLDLGKSVKIKSIKAEDFIIMNSPNVTIATCDIPRVLKGLREEEEEAAAAAAEEELAQAALEGEEDAAPESATEEQE